MTKLIATMATILITAPSSFAGVQEFEDEERPLWFDAVGVGNYTTIHFDELPNNTTVTDQYQPLGVTFSGLNFITVDEADPDGWALRMFDGNDIYFEDPINWFAVDIRGSIRVELFLNDQLIHTSQIFGAGPTPHSGGVISDQPFDRIFIYDPSDNLAIAENIFFGPPIPSPGVLALAPLVLLFRRRRR